MLAALHLTPTGQTPVHTPSTGQSPHVADQYDVSLALVHPEVRKTIRAIPLIAADLSKQNLQALIGRDVLEHRLFVYDGPAGIFALAF